MALIGYVLLTHGPKHTAKPLARRPGAPQQIAAIQQAAAAADGSIYKWAREYVRRPKGPQSFPVLFKLLKIAKETGAKSVIVMDDAARLFRRHTPDDRTEMLKALEPYRSFIHDARRRKLLSSLENPEWIAMLLSAGAADAPRPPTTKRNSCPEDTAEARRMSAVVRGREADARARKIAALRDELSSAGVSPSHVELARQANERGLRTSRDKEYTDVAVARALKRIDGKQSGD